jgi:hypothetical protein
MSQLADALSKLSPEQATKYLQILDSDVAEDTRETGESEVL